MGIFKGVTAEEVAEQHQFLIDILLRAVLAREKDIAPLVFSGIEEMIVRRREHGADTAILEASVASLGPRPSQQ